MLYVLWVYVAIVDIKFCGPLLEEIDIKIKKIEKFVSCVSEEFF